MLCYKLENNDESCTNLSFGASNRSGSDGSSLVEPRQNLGHAPVRYQQLPRDVTRPHSEEGQLNYPPADAVRKGTPVHEHPAKLIHPSLPCTDFTNYYLSRRKKISKCQGSNVGCFLDPLHRSRKQLDLSVSLGRADTTPDLPVESSVII